MIVIKRVIERVIESDRESENKERGRCWGWGIAYKVREDKRASERGKVVRRLLHRDRKDRCESCPISGAMVSILLFCAEKNSKEGIEAISDPNVEIWLSWM